MLLSWKALEWYSQYIWPIDNLQLAELNRQDRFNIRVKRDPKLLEQLLPTGMPPQLSRTTPCVMVNRNKPETHPPNHHSPRLHQYRNRICRLLPRSLRMLLTRTLLIRRHPNWPPNKLRPVHLHIQLEPPSIECGASQDLHRFCHLSEFPADNPRRPKWTPVSAPSLSERSRHLHIAPCPRYARTRQDSDGPTRAARRCTNLGCCRASRLQTVSA
jgi:hypothetical protein